MLTRDRVIDAADTTLHERPKPLDGIRVDVPTHVDAFRMANPMMNIAFPRQAVIGPVFIGVDRRRRQDAFLDVFHQGRALHAPDGCREYTALSLDDAEHRRLIGARPWAASPHVALLATNIGFVNFDGFVPPQGSAILRHQLVPN